MSDLSNAYDAITGKQHKLTNTFNYYDGNQPLVYANERLREVFAGVEARFTENWCAVVIDTVKERIQLRGFEVPASVQGLADSIWEANELSLESDDLHTAALVTGESYLIVQGEGADIQMFYNDPRLCQAFYSFDNPRQMRYAAKMWIDDAGYYRMTLYYPDRFEYYRTAQKATQVSSASAFVPDDTEYPEGQAVNTYGTIPLFHFKTRKRDIQGDLIDVIPVQNGINKLMTDMMVAAEYGAFRQRWTISNADLGTLKNSPNEIWNLPGGDGIGQQTTVGEFSPTDLANYLNAISQLAGDIARITRTPKHYMYGQSGDPSGEALIAMEAPLNRKVQDRIERFTPVWKQVMSFVFQVAGKSVPQSEIIPLFETIETVQPKTQAEIRMLAISAGIPLNTELRREGWNDSEIESLTADKVEDNAQLGDSLLSQFSKGQ